jgi:hypothetical protein
MQFSGVLRRVALVRTDFSEELIASIIWATRIDELGTALAETSNRPTLQRNTNYMERIGELGPRLAVTSN